MTQSPVAHRPGKAVLAHVLLAIAVLVTFASGIGNGFVNYDDDTYVTQNPHLRQGLSPAAIGWALSTTMAGNWHPLTWLSHLLDYQLFGLEPWGHHLTSVVLHLLNTLLVFALLRRLTGATGRSFVVAAFFGLHPLHVQSVAWVAERKDVLSALFFLLSLASYGSYACGSRPRRDYALALLLFALGLLAKPMLVTLPLVLLLLDFWPLGRWGTVGTGRLLVEKVPFALLAAGSAVITFVVQRAGGGVVGLAQVRVALRAENALVSYARYLGKLLWPTELAVLYPLRPEWPLGAVVGSGLLLLALSFAVVRWRRRLGYLFAGWFWFLGMLVPVIGLVQVGEQSIADRYMYLPMLGLLIGLVWGLAAGATQRRALTQGLAVLAGTALLACAIATDGELHHWRDSEALFARNIAATGGSATAHYKLGMALNEKGKLDAAYQQLARCLDLAPGSYLALAALGAVSNRRGQHDQAIGWLEAALKQDPGAAESYYQLGVAFDGKGRLDEAVVQYENALRFQPTLVDAHLGLGVARARQGRMDEAMAEFARALALDPESSAAYYDMGLAHSGRAEWDEAAAAFRKSLALRPDNADAYNNLGLVLQAQGKREDAAAAFREALRLMPDHERARSNLEMVEK